MYFLSKRVSFIIVFNPLLVVSSGQVKWLSHKTDFCKKGRRELSSVLIALIINITNPWLYIITFLMSPSLAYSFCFKLNCKFSETVAICFLHSSTQCTIPVFQGDLLVIVNLLMIVSPWY